MGIVSVRDLRNRSADMLARVAQGESFTVTRDGEPVAAVVPLPRRLWGASQLVERWSALPRVDAVALRAEVDHVLDPSL